MVAHDIRAALIGIRNVWPAVINASKAGSSDRVTGSPAIAQAVSAHILDVRIEVQHDLRFYTMLILDQVNKGTISAKVNALDIDDMGKFIDTWALHFCEQMPDDAEDCRRDLQGQAKRLLELVRGDQTHRYQIGRCPEIGLDEAQTRCPGELWATMRASEELLPKHIQCDRDNDHEWLPYQWHSLGKRLENADAEDARLKGAS
jgi:hypothetical protein